jgi:hypothetical protein
MAAALTAFGAVAFLLASIAGAPVPSLVETMELRVGASTGLGASSERTILFEKVDSDGRCPKGVTCVWEGDAVVRLSVGSPGETRTTLLLHTNPKRARAGEHGGYRITLIELAPYPTVDGTIKPDEYRARLNIEAVK